MSTTIKPTSELRTLLDQCLTQHFGIDDTDFHKFIEDNAGYKELTTGEYLIRDGDRSQEIFFLLTGHLRAIKNINGETKILGEIGRGETIGELALFTGKARSADVIAIRDSVAVKISREIIEDAISKKPNIAIKITQQIIERFERANSLKNPPAIPVNITLLPITADVDMTDLVQRLVAIRAKKGDDICVIDHDFVARRLGGLDGPDVTLPRGKVSLGISDLELKHDALYFVADPTDRAWCQTAIHHSDEVVLIADATSEPHLSDIEKDLLGADKNLRVQTTLVLLHPRETKSPSQTKKWLKPRSLMRHIHVRKEDTLHYQRLSRILSGRGVGLVLAGGGARGLSHLGILAALDESGLTFDFVGGTSAGAIMGSFAAQDIHGKEMAEKTRDVFVNSPHGDITSDYNKIPYLSLLKGKRALAAMHKNVLDNGSPDMDLEDCWKNYFVVASNFTTYQEQVLTHGNMARSVVASASIPGVMPPALFDGDLLFDGGSFNNFPVDHMRQMGARYIIGSDLMNDTVYKYEQEKIPSSWAALRDRLRPKSKRRYRVPTLPATLLTATVITSMARQKSLREHVDILFQPDTKGITLLDWSKYDQAFENGRKHALDKISMMDDIVLSNFKTQR